MSAPLRVNVEDVQNTPPKFQGSTTGIVSEDAPIGSLVMTLHAEDGDTGNPRPVMYELTKSKYPCEFCVCACRWGGIFIF